MRVFFKGRVLDGHVQDSAKGKEYAFLRLDDGINVERVFCSPALARTYQAAKPEKLLLVELPVDVQVRDGRLALRVIEPRKENSQ